MRVALCLAGGDRVTEAADTARLTLVSPFVDRGDSVDVFFHQNADNADDLGLGPPPESLGEYIRTICVDRRVPGGDDGYARRYWSMARVGKLLIQTEQTEGRYALVIWTRPDVRLAKPLDPDTLMDGKVHVPVCRSQREFEINGKRVVVVDDRFACGPSTDMQLYLGKFKALREFQEGHEGMNSSEFTAWSLAGQKWTYEGQPTPWVEDPNIQLEESR